MLVAQHWEVVPLQLGLISAWQYEYGTMLHILLQLIQQVVPLIIHQPTPLIFVEVVLVEGL